MNRIKKEFIAPLLFCFGLSSCVDMDNNKQYVMEDFVACTDLKDTYTIVKSEFEANQAFTLAQISYKDKARLLDRFQYVIADSLYPHWGGYVNYQLFDLDSNYLYYMADYNVKGRLIQGHEIEDGYYIIGVSKTKNEIVFCENFPELPLSPF